MASSAPSTDESKDVNSNESSDDVYLVPKESPKEVASTSADAAAIFSVDHSRIPRAEIALLPGNIVQEAYDQSVFETEVLAQVEEAAEREQRENLAAKRRLIKNIDLEIKSAKGERLTDLTKKRQRLQESLAAAKSVAAVSSALFDSRTEAVRAGKATPFGTVVVEEESEAPSAFDNFLAGIGTRRQKVAESTKAKQEAARNKQLSSSSDSAGASSSRANYAGASSSASLHTDMQSVSRLLKHQTVKYEKEDAEDDDDKEYVDDDDDDEGNEGALKRPRPKPKQRTSSDAPFADDADLSIYLRRLRRWEKGDAEAAASGRSKEKDINPSDLVLNNNDEIIVFEDGLRVPARLWRQLYSYQRTGVRWLWELHCQQVGGILADEMGLGKTVEISAFLFAVRLSRRPDIGSAAVNVRRYVGLGPVLIVCPVTLLRQWAAELHIWAPVFRAVILHQSTGTTSEPLGDLLLQVITQASQAPPIIITSYATLLTLGKIMMSIDWHYVILDEGHKIRNPEAKITSLCKQFPTCHRIVVSGSPMQNNLRELWCLFDFIYPGKLGSQSEFLQHLAIPIVQGGYASATPVQLQSAYKCAVILRDTINPYMLRRTKNDVKSSLTLPSKTEQVLFCKLTDHQEHIYISYLNLNTVKRAISTGIDGQPTATTVRPMPGGKFKVKQAKDTGKGALFAALVRLRHICNHPDMGATGAKGINARLSAKRWQLSAKMVVVESLLRTWHEQGHRVLLFSQTRSMLDILEEFVHALGFSYYRMDGETAIGQRQNLIADFNHGRSKVFVFLLTTRVGGLGINLTGADRVIIYDPDWNPTTDTQARERAWRIGQTKEVVIYRLLTAGTIEEKVYHRQIFKQFLTNRVLKDPKQRRFFKVNDIHELFTYTGASTCGGANSSGAAANSSSGTSRKSAPTPGAKYDPLLPAPSTSSSFPTAKKRKSTSAVEELSDNAAKKKTLDLAKRLSQKFELAKSGASSSLSSATTSKGVNVKKEPTQPPDERKRQKEHRSNNVVVDGVKIPNAVRLEVAKPSTSASDVHVERSDAAPSSDQHSEQYVLKRLLKCAGVSDSIDFESLVASRPDSALIDAEASRVAEAAVQALRQSQQRQQRSNSRFGAVTSQSGASAQPRFGQIVRQTLETAPKLIPNNNNNSSSNNNKFGAGSSAAPPAGDDLLNVLRKRAAETMPPARLLEARDDSDNDNLFDSDDEDPHVQPLVGGPVEVDEATDTLLTDIRAFIAFQASSPGQATSDEIVKAFSKERTFGDAEFRVFRHLLRRLCNFARRPSDGAGLWTLRSSFR